MDVGVEGCAEELELSFSSIYCIAFLCMQDIAHHDFAFEDINLHPEEQYRILAEALGLAGKASTIAFPCLPWQ